MEYEYAFMGWPMDLSPQVMEETNPVLIAGAVTRSSIVVAKSLNQIIANRIKEMPGVEPISHDVVRIGSTLVLTILVRYRKP